MPSQQLNKLGLNITYQEGLPKSYGNPRGEQSLIILDDLLQQVYSKDVCDLSTKGSHQRNISVLLHTQNIFHQSRTLSGHIPEPKIFNSTAKSQRQGTVYLPSAAGISGEFSKPLKIVSRRHNPSARVLYY